MLLKKNQKKKIEKNIDPNNKADYDISEILVRAKQKFKEFDKNGNNVLDGDEVLNLSDWVWENFNLDVDGKPMRKIEKVKMASDLLKRCDKNDDGKIDYGRPFFLLLFGKFLFCTLIFFKMNLLSGLLLQLIMPKNEVLNLLLSHFFFCTLHSIRECVLLKCLLFFVGCNYFVFLFVESITHILIDLFNETITKKQK